ncbi:MAG TPA: hypothetical protein VFM66_00855 [Agromyces sp.]|nr:hypothetical protein [Agromyces sp.]
MKLRTFLIVPAALAVAVLAGCGQGTASGSGAGSGSAQLNLPSTAVCSAPDYVREHAPVGLCADVPVDDNLSPLGGH